MLNFQQETLVIYLLSCKKLNKIIKRKELPFSLKLLGTAKKLVKNSFIF